MILYLTHQHVATAAVFLPPTHFSTAHQIISNQTQTCDHVIPKSLLKEEAFRTWRKVSQREVMRRQIGTPMGPKAREKVLAGSEGCIDQVREDGPGKDRKLDMKGRTYSRGSQCQPAGVDVKT